MGMDSCIVAGKVSWYCFGQPAGQCVPTGRHVKQYVTRRAPQGHSTTVYTCYGCAHPMSCQVLSVNRRRPETRAGIADKMRLLPKIFIYIISRPY